MTHDTKLNLHQRLHAVMGERIGRPPVDMALRFADKHMPEPNSGCWLWTGNMFLNGYGAIRNNEQKYIYAHRASFEIHKGSVPIGAFVCHKCDVRLCVNPDHLYAGTPADNVRDMHERGRYVRAFAKTPYTPKRRAGSRFSDDEVRAIRGDVRGQSAIARAYSVDQSTISCIRSGRHYRHVS